MAPNTNRISAFQEWARSKSIVIDKSIAPHQFPDRGLGIAATRPIKKNTMIMRIPMSAVIEPSAAAIPRATAKRLDKLDPPIRAHAKLAAHIAFGKLDEGWESWQATWPTFEDFQSSLPLLWPERVRATWRRSCERSKQEDTKSKSGTVNGGRTRAKTTCTHDNEIFAILPPAVAGIWATIPNSVANTTAPKNGAKSTVAESVSLSNEIIAASLYPPNILPKQAGKFARDLLAARTHLLPHLSLWDKSTLARYTWAWCIVNTRCFYYVAPGALPPAPADVDEAMVCVPAIDLFNHTSTGGCEVSYDAEGFSVRANRDYAAGEEVVTNYGSHGEDVLMVEYGFLLGGAANVCDGVGLDGLVAATLARSENKGCEAALADHGYLGEYTLRRDGVCWRTEVAAGCVVMERRDWEMFVRGRWTDEEDETNLRKKRRRRNGGRGEVTQTPKQMMSRQIREWVEQVGREARRSLAGLEGMEEGEVRRLFADSDEDSNGTETSGDGESNYEKLADARYGLVVTRWKQIQDTVSEALESLDK